MRERSSSTTSPSVVGSGSGAFSADSVGGSWTTDGLPDGYGSFARTRLNRGKPLTEQQFFDLITASYNAGCAYVRSLVEEHRTAWVHHTNQESAEYLDRVRHYTLLYQRAQ